MKTILPEEFTRWDRFFRGNFINSLSGYKSASLIATKCKKGKLNLAIFSNLVHIGADPALIGFINRPKEAAPHTLKNIEDTGTYTINHIHPDFVDKAHQTSAKYADDVSEFEAVGLTPEFTASHHVPYVQESKVGYRLSLVEIVPILHNNTFLVIGKVEEVRIEPSLIQKDGFLALHQVESVASLGIDAYYLPLPLSRFAYAKVDVPMKKI